MQTVVLVVHLMIVVALVALVLIQRSEGGALGIGGGGNFLASRGTGNVLTRTTTYLAAGFFVTSIGLTVLAKTNQGPDSILDNLPADAVTGDETRPNAGNILDLIRPPADTTPAVPTDAGGGAATTTAPVNPATPVVPTDVAPATTPVVPTDTAPAVPTEAAPTTTPTVPNDAVAPAATPAVPNDAATPAADAAAAPAAVAPTTP